jgi:HAD superfamily hydrolase (TIGR01450 family)
MTVSALGVAQRKHAGFDAIFFDFDGTVCVSGVPIGGVVEKLNRYLARDAHYGVLVTNNSSKSRRTYLERLDGIGIDCARMSVVTPVEVGADHLRRKGLTRAYILGTRACIAEFAEFGIQHDDEDPQCVIVAFDTETSYAKLDRCCEFMRRPIPTFQTNIDRFCPTSHGPAPDCGSIQALLTTVTNVKPKTHFGKPGRMMSSFLTRRFALKGARVAVVGDRQATDVLLGNRLGAVSVWVRSGDPTVSKGVRLDCVYETMEAFLDECA